MGTVLSAQNPPSEHDDGGGEATYRIRVDEIIHGELPKEVQVVSGRGGGDCSVWFKVGEQYLVQPTTDSKGLMSAWGCTLTQTASSAAALIPQLRAMRDHEKVASLYGVLERFSMFYESNFTGPVPQIAMSLKNHEATYTATTDDNGAYSFYDVAPGKYQVGAALPDGFKLGINKFTPAEVNIDPNACVNLELEMTSTASIRGRVSFPDGTPAHSDVQLFPVNHYKETERGMWEYQSVDFFEFDEVPPGDYLLVANHDRRRATPDEPFEQTFWPGTTVREQAVPIHLGEGQHLKDITLMVHRTIATRQITVIVDTTDIDTKTLYVSVDGRGDLPSADKVSPGVFRINVLPGSSYTLTANSYCTEKGRFVSTAPLTVQASDETQELRLTFAGNTCSKK